MSFLAALWLPILVAAILCFVASAAIWMIGPHHKTEWRALPNQDEVMALIRAGGAAPGGYMLPYSDDPKAWKDPEFLKKMDGGCLGTLYLRPGGMPNMGPMMARQFGYFLFVTFAVAYLSSHALPAAPTYLDVFRIAGTTAFLANGVAVIPESIWFGRPWKSTWLTLVDALIYACLTAGVFGWLWPR